MGNLLVSPITEKETERGQTSDGELTYAVSSMQGWRVHMEDAHICEPSLYAEERISIMNSSTIVDSTADDSNSNSNSSRYASTNMSHSNDNTASSSSSSSAATTTTAAATDNDTVATKSTTTTSSTSTNANLHCNSDTEDDTRGQLKKAKTSTSTCNISDKVDAASVANDVHSDQKKCIYQRIDLPDHTLFAVFDGHGGTFAAQYASLNFVRVLARQPSFVQYAKFVREQDVQKNSTIKRNDGDSESNNNGSFSSNREEENSINATNLNDNHVHQNRLAQNHRKGLELLEDAFRDAFLDVDREIWRIVQNLTNEDCILPSSKRRHNNNNNNDNDVEMTENHHHQEDEDVYNIMQDSGTTAVVIMITPQYIICANAGDSRSIYSKQNNSTIPLSYDHKPDDEEEEKRIRDAGGFVRAGRVDGDLAVSRGLGDFRFKEYQLYKLMGTTRVVDLPYLSSKNRRENNRGGVKQSAITTTTTASADDDNMTNANKTTNNEDFCRNNETKILALSMLPDDQKVSPVPDIIFQKRDRDLDEFVVIACDGVFDVQSNQECIAMTADIFYEGETDLGLVCEEILDLCLAKGSKDNMTALVIKFPAQPIGEGGGVAKRREEREMQAQASHEVVEEG